MELLNWISTNPGPCFLFVLYLCIIFGAVGNFILLLVDRLKK